MKKPVAPIITNVPEALDLFQEETLLGMDLETSGLHFQRDEIAVVSLYGAATKRTAILHVQGVVPPALIEFLGSPRIFVGHNIGAFDLPFLAKYQVDLDVPTWFDTLIAESITLTSARKDLRVSLQAAIKRRLNLNILKDAGGHTWMAGKLTEAQLVYCQEDVQYLPRLRDQQLKAMGPEQKRALDFELQLVPTIVKIALRGLPIDFSKISAYEKLQAAAYEKATTLVEDLLGEINLASPSQIVSKVAQFTGYTLPRTTMEALQTMAVEPGTTGELGQALVLLRGDKQTGTGRWLEDQTFMDTLYPRYRQINRDDGRLEITEPDLTKLSGQARQLIGGVWDHVIASVQYQNLWWGVMAYLGHDPDMQKIATQYLPTAMVPHLWPDHDAATDTYALTQVCRALTRACLFGHPVTKLEQHLKRVGMHDVLPGPLYTLLLSRYRGLAKLHAQARKQAQMPAAPVVFPSGMKRVIAGAQPWEITSLRAKGTVGTLIKTTIQALVDAGMDHELHGVVGEELVFVVPAKTMHTEDYPWITNINKVLEDASKAILGFPLVADVRIGQHWST